MCTRSLWHIPWIMYTSQKLIATCFHIRATNSLSLTEISLPPNCFFRWNWLLHNVLIENNFVPKLHPRLELLESTNPISDQSPCLVGTYCRPNGVVVGRWDYPSARQCLSLIWSLSTFTSHRLLIGGTGTIVDNGWKGRSQMTGGLRLHRVIDFSIM